MTAVYTLAVLAAVVIAVALVIEMREKGRQLDEVALETLGADKVHPRILARAQHRFRCVSCQRTREVPLADVLDEDLAAPRRCASCSPRTAVRA